MRFIKDWWNQPFDLSFDLPHFAIRRADRQDHRTISGENQPLRKRWDLSFLHLRDDNNTALSTADPIFLHQVAISFSLVGFSERYWTVICLADEYHEEESRLESEPEDESEESVGRGDPIISEEASIPKSSPRTYFLRAIASEIARIVEEQVEIGHTFHDEIPDPISALRVPSQLLRRCIQKARPILHLVIPSITSLKDRLGEFLDKEDIGSRTLPKDPLFQGLEEDPSAMGSLRSLRQSRAKLCEIERSLQSLIGTCDDLREAVSRSSHCRNFSLLPSPGTLVFSR